ncbi:peptide-methionine (S)-S-oxide reductase MsrA [Candidatus Woesearchaeota archaeon]|nr:peptide-methionine (S)-S-oxide reductase MsrA [Candidatus Woesearchaeota archaeon]
MKQQATFGAGCFWEVEETFRKITGVLTTVVGYMGGKTKNPTYEQVCTDGTGHAEVVHLEYEDSHVTYEELLNVFWANHNPTTPNQQGPDEGSQYRSVIFYHTPEQKKIAEESKKKMDKSGKWKQPIITLIVPASTFYRAEEYHQKYLRKREAKSCHI